MLLEGVEAVALRVGTGDNHGRRMGVGVSVVLVPLGGVWARW